MPFNTEIGTSLESIRFRIMSLPVDYSFKTLLLSDINRAIYNYGNQEIRSTLDHLSVLIRRIFNYIPKNIFQCDHFDMLCTDIDKLQQAITASLLPPDWGNLPEPAVLRKFNAMPTTPAPEPVSQKSVEPGPVESELDEPKVMEQVSIEPKHIEPESVVQETVIGEDIKQETVIREDTVVPVSPPGPEKGCLRWNFPVRPSR